MIPSDLSEWILSFKTQLVKRLVAHKWDLVKANEQAEIEIQAAVSVAGPFAALVLLPEDPKKCANECFREIKAAGII